MACESFLISFPGTDSDHNAVMMGAPSPDKRRNADGFTSRNPVRFRQRHGDTQSKADRHRNRRCPLRAPLPTVPRSSHDLLTRLAHPTFSLD